MTILTIISKELKTRINFSKPIMIGGIQMIDYSFPTFHNVFKDEQTLKRGITTLITFPKDVPFTFLNIVSMIDHGISGISIHHLRNTIHIRNSVDRSILIFSDELKKALNVCYLLPLGVNYCISETQNDYHISLKGMDLGLVYKNTKTEPSDLLAVLPSTTMHLPSFTFEPKLVNYIDLEMTTHEGNDVNFHDKPFQIVLVIRDN